jgi:hypothetical protein
MGIGASISLIAFGAIIAFAIHQRDIGWLDLHIVGWVLMLSGVAVLLTTLYQSRRRRRPSMLQEEQILRPEDREHGYTEEIRHEVHPPERRF